MKQIVTDSEEYNLLVRIAWAYYIEGLTQEEIANMYGISRMKVQRLIQEVIRKQLVTLEIKSSYANLLQVEHDLIHKFGLHDAVVVPNTGSIRLEESLSLATAMYLSQKWLSKINVLGIGPGRTLSYLGNAFQSVPHAAGKKSLKIVSLQGVLTQDSMMSSLDNGQKLAQALETSFYGIWSPCNMQSIQEKQVIESQVTIQNALKMANSADMKVVSVGGVKPDDSCILYKNGVLDDARYKELKQADVCGEILAHFFDTKGSMIRNEISDKAITVDIPSKTGKVLGVSGGAGKIAPLLGCLAGKLVDILVTDYTTCVELLKA